MTVGVDDMSYGYFGALIIDACEALTGRHTSVVWRDCIRGNPSIRGTCYRDGEKAVIVLKKNLSIEQTYLTALHEISHCHRTWSSLWDVNGKRIRLPDHFDKAKADAKAAPIEEIATTQARVFDSWACKQTAGAPVVYRLAALKDYPT